MVRLTKEQTLSTAKMAEKAEFLLKANKATAKKLTQIQNKIAQLSSNLSQSQDQLIFLLANLKKKAKALDEKKGPTYYQRRGERKHMAKVLARNKAEKEKEEAEDSASVACSVHAPKD